METCSEKHPSYFSLLEDISASASGFKMEFSKTRLLAKDSHKISQFLGITHEQTVFFASILELSLGRTATLETMARHFKCSILKLLDYINDLELLEKKGYILKTNKKLSRKFSVSDTCFIVPQHVIDAFRKGDAMLLTSTEKTDLPSFLKLVFEIIDNKQEKDLSTRDLFAEIEFLISCNKELTYVSYIDNILKQTASKGLVFGVSYAKLKGQYDVNVEEFADTVFDDLGESLEFINAMTTGSHELITNNIMKPITTEFEAQTTYLITEPTARLLYQDYPALLVADLKVPNLISHKSLAEKKLYFNQSAKKQIRELESILKPAKLSAYIKALTENKLTTGITAIFSGAPGTGKTEAVYQIARKTGRDIFMVDLSQTKSKWFGESEKLVKQIFNNYSVHCKNRMNEPILFINEADGLFSKRREISGQSSSVDQAMNTIQNILLQALENFEGVLIATSNLAGNLDKAFERRFTFQIDFPKPDQGVRKQIWKNKLPELSVKNASELAQRFEITGGDIDVQIRQALLQKVLKKKTNVFEILEETCTRDHSFDSKMKPGFR